MQPNAPTNQRNFAPIESVPGRQRPGTYFEGAMTAPKKKNASVELMRQLYAKDKPPTSDCTPAIVCNPEPSPTEPEGDDGSE